MTRRLACMCLVTLPLLAASPAAAFVVAPKMAGAKITEVTANSAAAKVGLEVNDVIVSIDGKPVRTMEEYNKLMEGTKRVTLMVKDSRKGAFSKVEVPVTNGRIGIRFVIAKN